jgi:hypothetical protein
VSLFPFQFSCGPASCLCLSSSSLRPPTDALPYRSHPPEPEVGRFERLATPAEGMKGVRHEENRKQGDKLKTRQGHIALIRARRDNDGVVRLPLHPPEELVGGEGSRGHPRSLHGSLRRHLNEAEPALGQRQHPPPVECGDNPGRGKATIPNPPEGIQQRLQVSLMFHGQAPPPSFLCPKNDALRKCR